MRGHIRQRGKGSWAVVIDKGRDPATGRRQQVWETVKGNKRAAERRLAELQTELHKGTYVKPSKTTVAAFLRQWLDSYVATNCRESTYERYRGVIEGHLVPALGAIKLSALTPADLQAHYGQALKGGNIRGGGLSPWTVRKHHVILREALSHAAKWGLVPRNVALAVDPPKPPRPEARSLDSEAAHRILEAAQGTIWHPILHLSLYTGMRRGEILGLRWGDVGPGMGAVHISQAMQQLDDGRVMFQEPKTASARRVVALSPAASIALRAHRERQEADFQQMGRQLAPETLVFERADGTLPVPDSVTHAFARFARKAGVSGVHLHNLRHTHATLMLKAGIHPKVVSERLGHASVSFTLDVYSQAVPGLQEAAALKFDEALDPPEVDVSESIR